MARTHAHDCLACGYDLSGTYGDEDGSRICPECGRVNAPGDYELALQHMMRPWAWIATVVLLTAANVTLAAVMLLTGRHPIGVFAVGFFCCLVESVLVCSAAGRRAYAAVRVNKALLLAGALCCFGFVGTLLTIAVLLALRIGHL